ncbi:hypothetical protein RFI_14549 [Reticulomyxa filosa]|uniref:Uncharacterized protein n=1 Tax=Reticulomyxa filosa TaxID=46433 RepID=X6N9P7_RETFI|nr:hypothetical protein RFI_14549 [Reticulomyxa filosa]|eukprot:ETO22643.1 hypothetical protein RFI_14549 [Reticulomyxa filosa]
MKSNVVDLVKLGQWLENELFQDKSKKAIELWKLADIHRKDCLDWNEVNTLIEHCVCDYVESKHHIDCRDMVVVDVERAIEQIIFHIIPYFCELHHITEANTPIVHLPQFTFQDFCKLGLWLQDVFFFFLFTLLII